jgi:hypothetical protein
MSTCIVSAFYEIPSKASLSFYLPHLDNFFHYISQYCIFFTNKSTYLKIEHIVAKYNNKNITIHLLEFEDLPSFKFRNYDFWKKQCEIDVEKYHTPELSIMWFNKQHLVKKSQEFTDFDYYIWCDAGCIRSDSWKEICKEFGHRNNITNDKIFVQLLNPLPSDKNFFVYPDTYVAGAIIAANKNMWDVYINIYNNMLDCYSMNFVCSNSDQYITASCINKFPNLFNAVLYNDDIHSCPDIWFFFLKYL